MTQLTSQGFTRTRLDERLTALVMNGGLNPA